MSYTKSVSSDIGTPSAGFNVKVTATVSTGSTHSALKKMLVQVKSNNSTYYPSNSSKTCKVVVYTLDDYGDWNKLKTFSDTGSYAIVKGNTSYYTWLSETCDEWIDHKSDGTQKLKFEVTIDGKLSNYYPVGSFTKSVSITSINPDESEDPDEPDTPEPSYTKAGISSISASVNSSTEDITLSGTLSNASSSYTYYLTLMYGTTTLTQLTVSSSFNTALSSAVKNNIYSLIDSNQSGTLTAYVETYRSGSYVGTSSNYSFAVVIPSYTISLNGVTIEDTTTAYDSFKPNLDTFITNLSVPKLTMSASASTSRTANYGKTLGYLINNSNFTTNSEYIDSTMKSEYKVIATDNRVKSSETVLQFTKIDYTLPTLDISLTRVENSSSEVIMRITGTYYDGTGLQNLGEASLQYRFAKINDEYGSFTTISFTTSQEEGSNTITFDSGDITLQMLYTDSWKIETEFLDLLGVSPSNASANLLRGMPLWHGYSDVDGNQYLNIYGKILQQGNDLLQLSFDLANPIGKVIIMYNDTNPNTYYSALGIDCEWEKIKEDVYLKNAVNNSQLGKIDGTDINHKIPLSSIPSHNHGSKTLNGSVQLRALINHTVSDYGLMSGPSGIMSVSDCMTSYRIPSGSYRTTADMQRNELDINATHTHENEGGGQAYYPYFYGVYLWKRIS